MYFDKINMTEPWLYRIGNYMGLRLQNLYVLAILSRKNLSTIYKRLPYITDL